MPVFLDVLPRLNKGAAEEAGLAAQKHFAGAGLRAGELFGREMAAGMRDSERDVQRSLNDYDLMFTRHERAAQKLAAVETQVAAARASTGASLAQLEAVHKLRQAEVRTAGELKDAEEAYSAAVAANAGRLERALHRSNHAASGLLNTLAGVGANVPGVGHFGGLLTATGGLGGAFTEAGEAAGGMGAAIASGAGIAVAGLATVAVAAGGVSAALFEIGRNWDAMAKNMSFNTGLAGKQLQQLQQDVAQVATTTPAKPGDIATTMSAVTRALHLGGGQRDEVTEQIVELAEKGGQKVDVRALGQVSRAFKMQPDDVPKFLDQLYTQYLGTGLGVNDQLKALTDLGPSLQMFDVKNAGGALSFLTQFDQAGVDMKSIGQPMAVALKNLVNPKFLGGQFYGQDPATFLKNVLAQAQGDMAGGNQTGADYLLTQVFGSSRRGGGQTIMEALQSGQIDLGAKAGPTQSIVENAKKNETLGDKLRLVLNNAEVALKPYGDALFKNVSGWANKAGDWTKQHGQNVIGDVGHAFSNLRHALDNVGHALGNVWHALTNVWHAGENVWHALTNVWHAGENVWHALTNVWHAGENVGHALGNVWHAGENVVNFFTSLPQKISDSIGNIGHSIGNWFHNNIPGFAGGGPLEAPGPKGQDSALFWGAKGEHVLSAHDVDAMGGHAGVYAFRNALHRAGGGGFGTGANINTTGMQVDTLAVVQAVSQMFPGVNSIGGYRAPDGFNEHSSGEAADIMVGGDKALGDQIARFALSNAGQFGVEYVLWQQRQWNPDGTSSPMADRGSPTQNHMDHVHIRTAGGGFPAGGGPGPGGTGQMPSGTSSTPSAAAMGGFAGGFGGAMMGPLGGGIGGGMGGYYSQNPQEVAAAQDKLAHLNDEISDAEQRKRELKADASQSDKDKLDHEIEHLTRQRDLAAGELQKAQQGTFHPGSGGPGGGGMGGMGGMQFGTPLPENFGLNKGLGGLAEWLVDFLGDMAVAPIEGAMYRAAGLGAPAGGAGYMGASDMGAYAPSGGGFQDIGNFGTSLAPTTGAGPGAPGGGGSPASSRFVGDIPAAQFGAGPSTGWWSGTPPAPTAPGATPGPTQNLPPLPAGAAGRTPSWQGMLLGQGLPGAPAPGSPDWFEQYARQFAVPGSPSSTAFLPPVAGLMVPGMSGPRSSLDWQQQMLHGPGISGSYGGPQVVPVPRTPHLAGGGPSGSDTVPAWLSPNEFVVNAAAAKQFAPQLAWMNAQHFAGGGDVTTTGDTAPAPPPPPPPPVPAQQQAMDALGQPGQHDDDKQKAPGGGIGSTSTQSSKGLGISGGVIGSAEAAGAAAADAFSFGAGGSAVQLASQLLNRTVAYGGQMAGIAVQGIISTLFPADSPLSDFGNTLPGKLLTGIAGAKPAHPISAGNTQPPLKDAPGSQDNKQAPQQPGIGMQINGPMMVQAPDAQQFQYTMQRQQQMHQQAALQAPWNTPPGP